MTVTAAFETTGSIAADTAEHRVHRVETVLDIQSPAPRDDVSAMVTTAERMCFVLDAIRRPHEVHQRVVINGASIDGRE